MNLPDIQKLVEKCIAISLKVNADAGIAVANG